MFNLYIVEDITRYKHLIITPYIDFYTTTANFLQVNDLEEELLVDDIDLLLLDDYTASHLDWSTKVDRSKPFKLKPMSELNGRFFEFKYKSDVDYYNEDYAKHYAQGYADHIEDTGYEFANDKQINEVIFSATPLLSYQNDDKVYPTIFKLTNTTSNTPTEDPIDHNIRIMQVRKITGVSSWDLKSDSQRWSRTQRLAGQRQSSMGRQVKLKTEGIVSAPELPRAMPTAPVLLRSKEIGSLIPILQTTFHAASGVAKEVNP